MPLNTEALFLSASLARSAEAHLSETAWGLFTGAGRPEAFHPLLPPEEAARKGLRVLARVHAHPEGPARLSREESRAAKESVGLLHLVVDLSRTPAKWGGGRFHDAETFVATRVEVVAGEA